MLIWFVDDWINFAKWTTTDEIRIGELIFRKWTEIKETAKYIRNHRSESREIKIGNVNNSFKYSIRIFYTDKEESGQDFMQVIGIAPVMSVGINILVEIHDKIDQGKPMVLVGHVYDNNDDKMLRIIGKKESAAIRERILKSFE